MYRTARFIISTFALLLLSAALHAAGSNIVRLSLAGMRLNLRQGNYLKHDAEAGYYLNVSNNGNSVGLFLCPSRDYVAEESGDEAPLPAAVRGKLPRLTTGAGVNIGDTPQQVARKLGAMPGQNFYTDFRKERTYTYHGRVPVQALGGSAHKSWYYLAKYIFRHEHLWAIDYSASSFDTTGQ